MQATNCSLLHASKYLQVIKGAAKAFDITTEARLSAFLSQIAHESGNLAFTSENLNYSASSLMRVWPRHFPTMDIATAYERKPMSIANRAYANRMGNGDEASGEGWKYRGRGFIQLTGKDNVRAATEFFQEDFLDNPDKLTEPVWCALTAAWFWKINGLNELADLRDTLKITTRINGGVHGLEDRLARFEKASTALVGFDAISVSTYG